MLAQASGGGTAPEPSKEEGLVEEIVVTGTRTEHPRSRSPVATQVISREDIEARGAANVQEALRDQLGVESNPSFYGAHGTSVQMMGLDGSRVLVMVDGMRLIGDTGGAVDLRRLPVDAVERIEIVRGPMSSLYGTDALGGVINIVSRREERPGLHAGGLVEVRALPGNPVGGRRLAADGAWAAGRGGVQVGVSYQRLPSYDLLPGDETLNGPERQELSAQLTGFARGGDDLHVRGGVDLQRSTAQGLLEQPVPGMPDVPGVLVDLPDTFWRLRAHTTVELPRTSLGRVELRLANTYFAGATDKDRRDSPLDERRRKWHDHALGELAVTRQLGDLHTLSGGVQVTGEWFEQILTRVEPATGAARDARVAEVPRRRLFSEEAYVQDEIALGPLTLAPGARYVHHHSFGHELAPRLALLVRAHDRVRLRAQLGRGFRAPSAKELAFNFDHSFYGYKVVGNPDLLPETSVGVQGGAEVTLPRGLALDGTVYYNRLSNLIVTEIDDEQSRPELTVSTYRNVGRAFTAGADVALTWRPSPRLALSAGYAYLRARDESTGLPVPGRPPHTAQAALTVRVPRLETRADLRGRATARTVAQLEMEETPVWSPGWRTLDLRVAQPLDRWLGDSAGARLEVYAGVENLLGARRDPHDPADLRPEPGRVAYAGIRVRQ